MTEKDVLHEFLKLGWKVTRNDNICLRLQHEEDVLTISKMSKWYHCSLPNANDYRLPIDIKEHKLLTELFKLWGWL